MATLVRMPEVLTGVTEAAIQTWLVSTGQAVVAGTPLAEIETDKAVVEYAAEVGGVVLQLLVAEGENVPIGDPIAVIGSEGEPVDVPGAPTSAAPAPAASSAEERPAGTSAAVPRDEPVASPATGDEPPAPNDAARKVVTEVDTEAEQAGPASPEGGRVRLFATPLVRRIAQEQGIDLAGRSGSGPNGRIVRRDLDALISADSEVPVDEPSASAPAVRAAAPAAAVSGEFVEVPLTGMRRAIARRLVESTSTVPHFYLEADCRVDRLLDLRRQINESSPVRVSLNDLVLKAVAGALVEIDDANVTWGETVIRKHRSVDIAVAVAIDGGLVTPVLRDVDRLTLSQVAAQVGELAERARAGRLKQHELEGGAFSVSNLGMYGVSAFSAIINPPHAGILAVGAARRVPVVDDDALTIGTVMTVTLSADHRVLDGALAAQWLRAFTTRIENPLSMLV